MAERGRFIIIGRSPSEDTDDHDLLDDRNQRDFLAERLRGDFGIDSLCIHEPIDLSTITESTSSILDWHLARDGLDKLLRMGTDKQVFLRQAIQPVLEEGTWVIGPYLPDFHGYSESPDTRLARLMVKRYGRIQHLIPDLSLLLAISKDTQKSIIVEPEEIVEPDKSGFFELDSLIDETESYLKSVQKIGTQVIEFTISATKPEVHREIWHHVKGLLENKDDETIT